ncbi:MAG: hypothetical protein AUG49_09780 [Catenulispora sp. 13_1_20CM_3_70_7]|nr:MAG: hypothetical protein AUG49_09780 [Catenulispora sp. 13_1_20CM_3_70_7]
MAEVLRLDRHTHPSSRVLWDTLLERADGPDADKVDDLLRGEIATELASRAHGKRDWDAVVAHFKEAVEHYSRAGRPDRVIASEARILWSRAIRDQDADPAASATRAWPELDALLERIDAVLAAGGFADDEALYDARVQRLVVRQSRVFTARNPALRAADEADRSHWLAVFRSESAAVVTEAESYGIPQRVALVLESLAEYDATHDDPVAAEAAARRAIEIFHELDWPWRVHRARMLLGLALAGQERYGEAVQVLQTGITEAHPAVDADELTPLYRLLGESALQGGEPATAVRAFAEAAVRLDREGDAYGAVETRWRMSQALSMQGQLADAVAVLETLVETPIGDDEPDSVTEAEPSAGAEPSSEADESQPSHQHSKNPTRTGMLMVQIRADLARGLLALDEPRAAAVEFLHVADAVDGWPDPSRLTAAAAEAAGALALARNWDGARAALERAIAANAVAPRADRLREEFADVARVQFVSVEVDEAQARYTRAWALNAADRSEEALGELERSIALYDRPGFSDIPPRYEAIRFAAIIEFRTLNRHDAAKSRLDKAIAEAEAAGHHEGLATLQKLRDALR